MKILIRIIKLIFFFFLLSSVNEEIAIKAKIFDYKFIIKIKDMDLKDKDEYKDIRYILNYKGEQIEPEWEWVKNISFVYTWVDGSDLDLSFKKSKYNEGNRNANSRDRSAEELRYSIRSLKKYLPWHNGTIFIVSDNQIPKWLNYSNNQIKIINHEKIIPKHINPTFDSSTIECFLDKIPGISEIFIYINDDFFFNNYIHPAFFFSSNKFFPKIFRTNEEIINKEKIYNIIKENNIHQIYSASVYFTYKIIRKFFDRNFKYFHIAHSAYVCYRSFFEPFRLFFENELKIVFSFRFRCPYKPITLYLYQMLLLYLNNKLTFNSTQFYEKKLNNLRENFLKTNNSILNYSFEIVPEEMCNLFIKFSSVNDDSKLNYEHFNYFLNNKNILLYNINDKYNNEKALYELTEYMIIRYPENTKFEKENYVNLEKEYLNKLNYANETINEINEFYLKHKKNVKYFEKLFYNKENLISTKQYITEKSKLSIKQNISKYEEEEISILFNYHGNDLEPKWEWIKRISMVYIITENYNKIINPLKFILRSIEVYLPWFTGMIFIVVQNIYYDLSWLNLENGHVKIVDPEDIVSEEFHGKFTKEIIEMYLDKIPFISERFIYLNDNYYFHNFIHPRFFFNEEFFPKYNFDFGTKEKPKIIQYEERAFYKTYDIIKEYFGSNYVIKYRKLVNSPISFFRDLFQPVRELYLIRLFDNKYKIFDLLPLYLLTTYNIYGTAQIYYPNYVSGFGKIRKIPPPTLKKNKLVSYYGYDFTSDIILEKAIVNINEDLEKNKYKLNDTNVLLFSINLNNNYNKNELRGIRNFLRTLYQSKSFFEI